jgi:NADH-quinone oxidoreductase subunit J
MIEVIFLIAAAVALISAAMTVTAYNAVHALLYLVVMMLAIALIFFLLGASFAAALQIIVYAGAVMVLFIFVTMMLHQGEKSLAQEQQLFKPSASLGPFLLAAVLLGELLFVLSTYVAPALSNTSSNKMGSQVITVKELGTQLYGPYQLLVVISALMLLSALISAIHIARRQRYSNQEQSAEQTRETSL